MNVTLIKYQTLVVVLNSNNNLQELNSDHVELSSHPMLHSKLANSNTDDTVVNLTTTLSNCTPVEGQVLLKLLQRANEVIFWNLNVWEAIYGCHLIGYIYPYTLLISGTIRYLEIIKTAWSKRLLRSPIGYLIETVGESLSECEYRRIDQVHSVPLAEALCYIVFDLNSNHRDASFERVIQHLHEWYHEMPTPPNYCINAVFQQLIASGQVYHTGYGYSIATHQKAAVSEWVQSLPTSPTFETSCIVPNGIKNHLTSTTSSNVDTLQTKVMSSCAVNHNNDTILTSSVETKPKSSKLKEKSSLFSRLLNKSTSSDLTKNFETTLSSLPVEHDLVTSYSPQIGGRDYSKPPMSFAPGNFEAQPINLHKQSRFLPPILVNYRDQFPPIEWIWYSKFKHISSNTNDTFSNANNNSTRQLALLNSKLAKNASHGDGSSGKLVTSNREHRRHHSSSRRRYHNAHPQRDIVSCAFALLRQSRSTHESLETFYKPSINNNYNAAPLIHGNADCSTRLNISARRHSFQNQNRNCTYDPEADITEDLMTINLNSDFCYVGCSTTSKRDVNAGCCLTHNTPINNNNYTSAGLCVKSPASGDSGCHSEHSPPFYNLNRCDVMDSSVSSVMPMGSPSKLSNIMSSDCDLLISDNLIDGTVIL